MAPFSTGSSMRRVVVVAGPTGVGKTALSIEVARAVGGEIISADAVAVYRHLDVGSAKPTAEERAQVPHHLVDAADPGEDYDAARFAREAGAAAEDILGRGRAVVLAGGTGLYIKAFLYGLIPEGESDPALREALREEARQLGVKALHERLSLLDPATAARVHENDAYRIVRALEIMARTGRPVSASRGAHAFARPLWDALFLHLNLERGELYRRIEERVDRMMAEGLLEEVRDLLDRGYGPDLKSMRSIGYRHMADVILGRVGLNDAVALLKRDTRRLAKRQNTWFRAVPGALRTDPGDAGAAVLLARRHFSQDR